jgi:hypothetical protein
MNFQPSVPIGGLAGWRMLQRTFDRQSESFQNSAVLKRETDHFRAKISTVTTAAELVADRQLLKVALGAFGLEEDLNKGYFIRKVLEEGTLAADSMANRLVDKRYAKFASAFAFDSPLGPRTARTAFPDEIINAYQTRSFEVAVGDSDENLRLALTFSREFAAVSTQTSDNNTAWYTMLGNPPVRKVIELALNLPKEFALVDIDRQVSTLKEKFRTKLGSDNLADLQTPERIQDIVDRFLVRSQVESTGTKVSGQSVALSILQAGNTPLGSGTLEAILALRY